MIQIVSGLVRELVSVESCVLVRNPRGVLSEEVLSCCARTVCAQKPCTQRVLGHTAAGTVKREEWEHNLPPLRTPHGLLKGRQQRLGVVAAPREIPCNQGIELSCRDFEHAQRSPTKRQEEGCDVSHSVHLMD